MSDRVAFLERRAVPRVALTGLALIWLSGCSTDVSRFEMSSNPFTNPFSTQAQVASAAPSPSAAPAGQVAATPLPTPTPVASAPLSAAPAVASAAPLRGGPAGWSASGGTPIAVGQGESLDSLSRRYGVPASALLAANGLSSPSEVRGGMNMIVPVYNAGAGHAVASAKSEPKAVAGREEKSAKKQDIAEREDKSAKADKKLAKADAKTEDKLAEKDKAKDKTVAEAKKATDVAKADKPKDQGKQQVASANAKKQPIDETPTGNVDPKAGASDGSPEFRWPARGRIIQGFRPGGNDGIDISVPAGTSVRAAENGVVVYSGDGLKGYGNLVLIKHPNGFVTAYANNKELDVKRGETVKRGQIIAKSGDSGNVNAPQLHFELRKGSTPVDPTQYLAGL